MVKRQTIKLPPDQLSARIVGRCNGSSFSWNCNNWASLRPVLVDRKVMWFCQRCYDRLRLGKKAFIKKTKDPLMWKKGVNL